MNPQLKQCLPCDASCKSCTGSYSNDCTSCSFDKLLVDGTCLPRCADGLYFDRGTSHCIKCHPSCSQCSGYKDNECTQCKEHFLMIDGKCRLLCLEGTYPDESKFECVNCHATCKDCVGPTRNNCTACFANGDLVRGACKLRCPDGFFANEVRDACEKCKLPCRNCFGGETTSCSSCSEGYQLSSDTCLPMCVDGYFDSDGNCNACDAACKGCSHLGARNCTLCKQDGILAELRPCSCARGYYLAVNGTECRKCHQFCSECKGPGAQDCIMCADGLYFDHVINKCSFICSAGSYVSGSECFKCDSSCQSCDGQKASDCLLCKDNLVLFNSSCIKTCPSGYYELTIHNKSICVACSKECKTCDVGDADKCTSCPDGLVLVGSKCIVDCASPYVLDSAGIQCILPEEKHPARKLLALRNDSFESIFQRLPYSLLFVLTTFFAIFLLVVTYRKSQNY